MSKAEFQVYANALDNAEEQGRVRPHYKCGNGCRSSDRIGGDGRKGAAPVLLPALIPREGRGNYFGKRDLE